MNEYVTADDRIERRIEPDGEAIPVDESAVVGIDEGAPAGRDDDVTQWQQIHEDRALHGTEIRLTIARKNGRDGAALSGFDALVDIFHTPIQPAAKFASERGLAGRHESDQVNFIGCHE